MITVLYEIHIYSILVTSCSGIWAIPYFQTILNMKSIKQVLPYKYSDTSANEDNSFRNHIR